MALKNINLDSVIRGLLDARADLCQGILDAADAKVKECGLSGGTAHTAVATHRRGPQKGMPKGSSNFNGRSVLGFIESVPAKAADGSDDASKAELSKAHEGLLAIHATLLGRGLKPTPPDKSAALT